jgi:hypothetical protein
VNQTLHRFQRATAAQAIRALRGEKGKRFLIADEVGLGKTVIASKIVRSLAESAKRRKKPFCIYYFASNLALLEQNRLRLQGAPGSDGKLGVDCFGDDRLSLGWSWTTDADLRIAVFTPGTSLPDLRLGKLSSGRLVERELASAFASIVMARTPDLRLRRFLAGLHEDRSRDGAAAGGKLARFDAATRARRRDILGSPTTIRRTLCSAFARSVAASLNLPGRPHGRTIHAKIRELLDNLSDKASIRRNQLAEIRTAFRVALCEVTLARGHLAPDLVILDEFQKYRELLTAPKGSLGERLLRSRVLLLSATPFERAHAEMAEQPITSLARFLYADRGETAAGVVEKAINKYRKLLLEELPPDTEDRKTWRLNVKTAKGAIEKILRPIIERTERWDDKQLMSAHFSKIASNVSSVELRIFDDFAARMRRAFERRRKINAVAHSTPLWMSVPYPVQTLPAGYVASKALALAEHGNQGVGGVPKLAPNKDKPPGAMPPTLDHPKLRGFDKEITSSSALSLPWVRPSMPWWELEGKWADSNTGATKSLVFCHYRATPPAIGGLISREVERVSGPRTITWEEIPRKARFAVGGSGKPRDLLALFYPWQIFARNFDPIKYAGNDKADVLAAAKAFVRTHFAKPLTIESLVAKELDHSGTRAIGKYSPYRSLLTEQPFRHAALDTNYAALMAVGAPGVICLRVFLRHYSEQIDDEIEELIFDATWTELRHYLGQRYFDSALGLAGQRRGAHGRRAAKQRLGLLNATIAGNLDAVLDEHLSIWRRLNAQRDSPREALTDLCQALDLKAGALALHERRKGRRVIASKLRAHVAVAFSGQEAAGSRRGSGQLRPTALRTAFNSPFWPHVLVTTSVGQEGLDFHVWCSRLVHWDIPLDPISLEQREGRVSRFGSLAVRRALARENRPKVLLTMRQNSELGSPWRKLEELVDHTFASSHSEKKLSGLQPWWVVDGGQFERVLLAPSFSQEAGRFEQLLGELNLYRLAIGQPDPENFVERLQGKLSVDELRQLAIDLSGAQLRSNQNAH